MRLILRTSFLGFCFFMFLSAQNPYGRITGRVTDSAGALVPGATVRAINIATNVTTTTVTSAQGNYELLNLNPGDYRVEVEHQGFKHYARGPIEVRVGDVLSVDTALELGAVTERITVTGETPLLEAASASLGQVVDSRRILDLPLSGANPLYLTQLTPGVISTTPPTHGWLPAAVDASSNIATNGTLTRSSEFLLNGIPSMTSGGMVTFVPAPEMVQEFRVETAAFDASVGHFTGAQVSLVLKAGTNDFHGNLLFSYIGRQLMSVPFFTNSYIYNTATGPVTPAKIAAAWPPVHTDRYRGTVGGPVYLPKLYNGRNRTFWMYGVDVLARVWNNPNYFTVPTVKERGGDFSDLLAVGSQYQIYDPATITAVAGGHFSRQPFPGNIVPSSRLDPIARGILNYYPLPNTSGTVDGRNDYYDPVSNPYNYSSHVVRIDQVVNDNHRLFGSFVRSGVTGIQNNSFHDPANGTKSIGWQDAVALNDVLTLRPNLVLELRAGMQRAVQQASPVSLGFDLASLGFPASLVSQLNTRVTSFPQISMGNYSALGGSSGSWNASTYYTFSGTLSHIVGGHSLRYGAEYRVLQDNAYTYGNVSPDFSFTSTWTVGPLNTAATAPIGQELAGFLLGLPNGGYADLNPAFAEQSGYLAAFVQDDWRLSRKLTLTLGMRYELELPTTERYNRADRGFDFTTPNPVQAAVQANYARNPLPGLPADQFNINGGLLFAGVQGAPRGMWNTDHNNFLPRVGLAYQLRPHTVVRAGYGIFYESLGADQNNVLQQGFSQRTTITPSLDNGMTFRATLSNPFPDGLLQPAGATAGLATFLGQGVNYFPPQRRPGYLQRWSFNVQHELPHQVLVEVGYVGNRGTDQGVAENFDSVPAQYLSTSPVRDQATINRLGQAVTNPFYGVPQFAGTALAGATIQLGQLVLPYPQFTSLTTTDNAGFSWYHSLQMRVERRLRARLHCASQLHLVEVHGGRGQAESHRCPAGPLHLPAGPAPVPGHQRHLRAAFRPRTPLAGPRQRLGESHRGRMGAPGNLPGAKRPTHRFREYRVRRQPARHRVATLRADRPRVVQHGGGVQSEFKPAALRQYPNLPVSIDRTARGRRQQFRPVAH